MVSETCSNNPVTSPHADVLAGKSCQELQPKVQTAASARSQRQEEAAVSGRMQPQIKTSHWKRFCWFLGFNKPNEGTEQMLAKKLLQSGAGAPDGNETDELKTEERRQEDGNSLCENAGSAASELLKSAALSEALQETSSQEWDSQERELSSDNEGSHGDNGSEEDSGWYLQFHLSS